MYKYEIAGRKIIKHRIKAILKSFLSILCYSLSKSHPPTYTWFLIDYNENHSLWAVVAALQHCLGYATAWHFFSY